MKKLMLTAMAACFIFQLPLMAQDVKAKDKKKDVKTAVYKETMDFPYKASYSSQFEMGNPALAKKVLELWKDYDENMLSRHKDYFADSLVVDLPNGTRLTGLEPAMKAIMEYRASQGKVSSNVDAWISTKSLDKNEEWVCIWGVETSTDASGKETKTRLHEIWQLNKDGKVVYMAQFIATPPQM